MGTLSIWHWLIVLAVVILIFGTKKLRNMGGDLGSAIKNFKQSMKDGESETQGDEPPPPPKQVGVAERSEAPDQPARHKDKAG